jgi:hypothetical protein
MRLQKIHTFGHAIVSEIREHEMLSGLVFPHLLTRRKPGLAVCPRWFHTGYRKRKRRDFHVKKHL